MLVNQIEVKRVHSHFLTPRGGVVVFGNIGALGKGGRALVRWGGGGGG